MTHWNRNPTHDVSIELFPNDWIVVGRKFGGCLRWQTWPDVERPGWNLTNPYDAMGFETVAAAEAFLSAYPAPPCDLERRHVEINKKRSAAHEAVAARAAMTAAAE